MRRRASKTDFGQNLRAARSRAGITLTALAGRSGVSLPSLSRFETGASQPGLADACAVAKALGVPLLLLADGRDRTSNDPRDLIGHLAYWGLDDLAPAETTLIGEARSFEALVAVSLTDAGTPRILEGIPALLLKNDFSTTDLEAQAAGARVLHRLGWLAETAEWIGGQISVSRIHPSASSKIRQVRQLAWHARQQDFAKLSKSARWPEGWDLVGGAATGLPANIPPIARKWKIGYWTPQQEFLARARDILAAVEAR